MKKTLFAFISFVLIFALFGCTANSNYEETEPTLSDEEISLQQQEIIKIGFSATDDEDVIEKTLSIEELKAWENPYGKYSSYLLYDTLTEDEKLIYAVRDCAGQSVGERKKTRADYYLENGKYELAIKEYELLLKEREDCTQTTFEGSIYHGMGVAFAKMFLFEQADYYLEKAYEILTEEKIAFRMLAAKRLYKSEQEYICYVEEHPELFEVSQCLEERLSESEKMWLVSEKKKQIDDLKKCLSSIYLSIENFHKRYCIDVEVIVADDHSDDRS